MNTDIAPRAGRKEWLGLAVLALPALLVSIDIFVLLLALPHLSEDLRPSSTQQLWITDIYGFFLAGFLITMGNLGDRIGRRRLLLIGATGFGLASVLAAFSVNSEMLIAARALLGVFGATLAPSTLALISSMFKDPKQRAVAIGVWMACFIGGGTLGPIVGGVMLENFWWGSVFLLGVPAMLLLLALGPVLLPEYRNPDAGRLDLTSVVLSLAAILPVIYGLKEFAKDGPRTLSIVAVIFGVLVAVAFIRRQRRLTHPLLDLGLFGNRAFSAALLSMLVGTMLGGAVMVFITQDLQLVQGLSPLEAGLWMVPAMAASIVSFQFTPLLARRIQPAYVIGGGLFLTVVGLLILTQVDATTGIVPLVLCFALTSFGSGPLVVLGTDLVMGSVSTEKAGSAAAVSETSNEFGFALGVALLGSLGTAIYRSQIGDHLPANLPSVVADASRDTLAGATVAAKGLPEQLASTVLTSAQDAFTTGLQVVSFTSAVLLTVVAVCAVMFLRKRPAAENAFESRGNHCVETTAE
jgi:DHA2 family multidrug resistance protein-like MFS transporter